MGEPKYRAKQIFKWLYEKAPGNFSLMTNLPKALTEKLTQHFLSKELFKR